MRVTNLATGRPRAAATNLRVLTHVIRGDDGPGLAQEPWMIGLPMASSGGRGPDGAS
jgi:hypothetical protein